MNTLCEVSYTFSKEFCGYFQSFKTHSQDVHLTKGAYISARKTKVVIQVKLIDHRPSTNMNVVIENEVDVSVTAMYMFYDNDKNNEVQTV